jgi:SnoaL-like protein
VSDHDRLNQLEKQVQYLNDRQAILDCISRTSRGNDRFDRNLITGSYHEDGVHEIGRNRVPGHHYDERANDAHATLFEANLHHVTMHLCEIEGDVAHAESYVIGLFLDKGAQTSKILSGRYIDRLEKRHGKWKIVVRRATVEVVLEGSAAYMHLPFFSERGYLRGSRDKSDLSYQRPLTLEGGVRWGSTAEPDGDRK